MGLAPKQIIEVVPVDPQIVTLEPLIELFFRQAGQFRGQPCLRFSIPNGQRGCPSAERLSCLLPHILIELVGRECIELVELDIDLVLLLEDIEE